MRNNNSLIWYFVLSVAGIVSLAGTLSFFWVPVSEVFQWFAKTIAANPVTENFSALQSVTWAALSAFAIVILAMAYTTRNRHLTVVTSQFVHEFQDKAGAQDFCNRRQIFRSNRPGVNSYVIGTRPDFGGYISQDSLVIRGPDVDSDDTTTESSESQAS